MRNSGMEHIKGGKMSSHTILLIEGEGGMFHIEEHSFKTLLEASDGSVTGSLQLTNIDGKEVYAIIFNVETDDGVREFLLHGRISKGLRTWQDATKAIKFLRKLLPDTEKITVSVKEREDIKA